MELDKKDLLKLYELNIAQEHYFLTEHQNRIRFFTGILTTLIGATIYGIVNINNQHLYLLTFGALIIVTISIIAIKASERLYQRFLEVITQKAKIEYKLKMSNSESMSSDKSWYETEPLVNKRYLEDRNQGLDSRDFVKKRMQAWGSYNAFATITFEGITVIGLILFNIIVSNLVANGSSPVIAICLYYMQLTIVAITIAFSALIARKPKMIIGMQKALYRTFNWKIVSIFAGKDIKNVRIMGLTVLIFGSIALIYVLLK